MKKRLFLFLTIVVTLITWSGIEAAQQTSAAQKDKVRPDVWKKVQEKGGARIGVMLSGSWELDSKLSKDAAAVQRQAIADAQKSLIAELAGTKYRVLSSSKFGPYMSLEVGLDALLVLESSNLVKDVYMEEQEYKPTLLQSVPLIGAPQVWSAGFDGANQAIVIIDTGVDGNHPFLSTIIPGKGNGKKKQTVVSKVIAAGCFSSGSNCPNGQTSQTDLGAGVPCTYAPSTCQHGTHVAGIAAGNGGTAIPFSGVAKGAKLITIQVFSSCTPAPCASASDPDIASALEYSYSLVGTLPYQISAINLSLGSLAAFPDQTACDTAAPRIKAAIDLLRNVGIATVIASGNDSCVDANSQPTGCTNGISSPGCISSAVSVGSTTKNDQVSAFSNSAPFLSLVAPGELICSSVPSGTGTSCNNVTNFDIFSGTSMAAPHVAGAWAILRQKNSTATVGQILNALQTTGVKVTDNRQGVNNRVNCRIQIDAALNNIPNALTTLNIPESVAYGINNCGQIVGTEYTGNGTGFIANTKGDYTSIVYNGPIEQPDGFYFSTEATAINNKGEVHGFYCCGNLFPSDRGFLRTPTGTMTQVNTPATNTIDGNNDFDDLVGQYFIAPPPSLVEPFIYVSGVTTTPSGVAPLEINNMRRVVGLGGPGGSQGVLIDENGVQQPPFNYPGAIFTFPSGINEAGQIVGQYWDSNNRRHGFLRQPDGTMTSFDYTGAAHTVYAGINDSGQIVGYYFDGAGSTHAFIDLSQ